MNKLKLIILTITLLLFFAVTAVRATTSYTLYLPQVQSDGAACADEFATREECSR